MKCHNEEAVSSKCKWFPYAVNIMGNQVFKEGKGYQHHISTPISSVAYLLFSSIAFYANNKWSRSTETFPILNQV